MPSFWRRLTTADLAVFFVAGAVGSGMVSLACRDGLLMGASGGLAAVAGVILSRSRDLDAGRQIASALFGVLALYGFVAVINRGGTTGLKVDHVAGFVIGFAFGLINRRLSD